MIDQLNDQLNDSISDVGLEILRLINNNPGINAQTIFKIMTQTNEKITIDIVRNSIRRELSNYVEHRGSKKQVDIISNYHKDFITKANC